MLIKDRIDLLGLKTGQPITEDWYDLLVDTLTDIAENGAITYDGTIKKSLKPYASDVISIGAADLELLSIFSKNAYAKSAYAGDSLMNNLYVLRYGEINELHANTLSVPSASIDDLEFDSASGASVIVNRILSSEADFGNLDAKSLNVYGNAYVESIQSGESYCYGDSYIKGTLSASAVDVLDLLVAERELLSKGVTKATSVEASEISVSLIDVSANANVYGELFCYGYSRFYGETVFSSAVKAYDDVEIEGQLVVDESISAYTVNATYGYGYYVEVDFLEVTHQIGLPNYSIGFIKIDPRLSSNNLRSSVVPAGKQILVPRGAYYVNVPAGVTVEANFNGEWVTVLTEPGLIISDGANVRLNNGTTTDQSVSMLMIY